jgi:hypothetical protein
MQPKRANTVGSAAQRRHHEQRWRAKAEAANPSGQELIADDAEIRAEQTGISRNSRGICLAAAQPRAAAGQERRARLRAAVAR